ncbi:plasmid pRiA4b ORF-3 family protein [Marivibrio halodurans]|uniref:Plasmid pRiA4b ORF-3 family protein n=1 Tax=Marivibrio halodurans TaxID=2039722 RepID=A0A8J7SJ85_9PROT|nr:plasmid pRiA4b ORF-3 family protein [Marivibrio halodurans]MBP5857558.1 plasmid pRiA4b ORF-3 family protein [Marivibrio halodurans]
MMDRFNGARLRLTLVEIDPAPWREIVVRTSMTLARLHEAIQAVFCWYDYHLWAFEVGDKHYGPEMEDADPPVLSARNARLRTLIARGVENFHYVYDFGDYWRVEIQLLDTLHVEDAERLPRFLGGAHAAPPEDIGGPPGYAHFLEVLNDPKHPDREDYAQLFEMALGGDFDPRDIQEDVIGGLLSRVARKKPAAPKRRGEWRFRNDPGG